MIRRTKIVGTIGPSCEDETTLKKLIDTGLNVARLNFSHGTHSEHLKKIKSIRKLSTLLKKPVAILQDLQGPKMRVGSLPDKGIQLIPGTIMRFISGETIPENFRNDCIPLDVPGLNESLNKGNRILMDDGKLEVQVTEVSKEFILAKVVTGGLLTSHKGVNLPGAKLLSPAFTEKDKRDLAFGLDNEVDAIAISFVRTADDIKTVRSAILSLKPSLSAIPIIAKLERPEAIDNLDEILEISDGVMVARGDLGVETSPSKVPIMQKEIIRAANQKAKLVITATQMLESMISNPRPTRAEASDVANAILDGTDAVMLSGETASGQYPIESVKMMGTIAEEAESHYKEWGHAWTITNTLLSDDALTMTRAGSEIAHDRNVAAISVFTLSGNTALMMSKARPEIPILAFTPEKRTYQKISMFWGVSPFLVPFASNVEDMLAIVEAALISSTSIKPGEQVVIISGLPIGQMRKPNFALLHTIGETI